MNPPAGLWGATVHCESILALTRVFGSGPFERVDLRSANDALAQIQNGVADLESTELSTLARKPALVDRDVEHLTCLTICR